MINYKPIRILFEFFGVKVYSWGFMAALAILIVFLLVYRKIKNEKKLYNLDENLVFNFAIIIIIAGFFGARLFWAIENSFNDFFKFWQGGLTWYGGLLFGFLGAFAYTKIKNLPSRYLEVISLFLPLGYSIARIGCFLNWDDYGLPTNLFFGIKVGNDLPRHPTQIYLSLANLLIFFILFIIDKKRTRERKSEKKKEKYKARYEIKKKHEKYEKFFLVKIYFILYALIRFCIDFLRDSARYLGLTLSQYISIFIIFFMVFMEIKNKKSKQKFKENKIKNNKKR